MIDWKRKYYIVLVLLIFIVIIWNIQILYCISTINIYSYNLEHTDISIGNKNRAKR